MGIWSYPPTRTQLAVTIGFVITGASLIGCGAYFSFTSIGPQQACVKARNDYVNDLFRKMIDD